MSCSTCSKCVLATLADGKEAVYKKIGELGPNPKWFKYDIASSDSVEITNATDLATLNAITTYLNTCDGYGYTIDTLLRDSGEELCFKDSEGELQFKGKVGMNILKTTKAIQSLEYIKISVVKTGGVLSTGEYNGVTAIPALYVSGSFAANDLKITLDGVEYTQGVCLTCGC
jgi:hypothetical protein